MIHEARQWLQTDHLRGGVLGRIADAMGVSESTVRRRLLEHGTRIMELVNQERARRLSEIGKAQARVRSEATGFTDTGSYYRWASSHAASGRAYRG